MKINIKVFIALTVGFFLTVTSCDVIDQPPVSAFTDATFWSNEADVRSALMGIYDGLQRIASGSKDDSWNWAAGFMAMGDWRAGGIQQQWGGTGCCVRFGGALINQDISPDISYANWEHFYDVINRINLWLDRAPNVQDPDFTETELKNMTGEAYLIRALLYFKMAQWWREVPIVLTPTTDPSVDLTIAKSSAEEVLAQVKSDIDFALQPGYLLSPESPFLEGNEVRGRATTMAAKALLVDYHMWKAEYQQAADVAKEIIDSGIYTLDGVDYYDNFLDNVQNTAESIWEIQYEFSANETSGHVYFSFSEGILVYGYRSQWVDLVRESGDYTGGGRGMGEPWWYRGAWKFIGANVPDEGSGPGAWTGSIRTSNRNNWTNDNNWILYRLADIMLMRAEALNRISVANWQEVQSLVNAVRNRAGVPAYDFTLYKGENISGDWKKIEDLVMTERWIELHGEGKRWFDLIRASKDADNNLPTNVSPDHYLVQWAILGLGGNTRQNAIDRLSNPGSWFMPIARREMELNPKLEQPAYWQ